MTAEPVAVVRADRWVDARAWVYQCPRCIDTHVVEARPGLAWSVCGARVTVLAPAEPEPVS